MRAVEYNYYQHIMIYDARNSAPMPTEKIGGKYHFIPLKQKLLIPTVE